MLSAFSRRLPILSQSRRMLGSGPIGASNGTSNGRSVMHTVTALKRWSCDDKDLPSQCAWARNVVSC